jgi:hypothetical protein
MDFYGFNHDFSVQLFHSGFLIIDKMSSSLQECGGDQISPSGDFLNDYQPTVSEASVLQADPAVSKADPAVAKDHSAYDGIDFCVLRNVLATVQLVGDVSVNRAEEETSTTGDENQRVNRLPSENLATDENSPPVVDLTQEE